MEQNSKLQFKQYKIISSYIKIKDGEISPHFNIEIDRDSDISENRKELNVKIKTKIIDDNNIVDIFVEMIGFFEFDSTVDDTTKNIFTKVSGPAILFPYVRAYIGALSSLSGINPIVLPTLNLADKI